ncbi:MAG: hypothetical protein J6O43_00825 [Clostridium sp.]|nr:hypothetical protein [Clostridium sp.]
MKKNLFIIAAASVALFAAGCGNTAAPETTAQETAAEETTAEETEETTEEEKPEETEASSEEASETEESETEKGEAEKLGFDVDELREIMGEFGGYTEAEIEESIKLGRIGKPDGACSCVFLTTDEGAIDTVSFYMAKDNPRLQEFLEACAGLDYEGADKERALSWIDSIAEDSLTANATIGDVTFQYMAISSNVMLSLAFAIG